MLGIGFARRNHRRGHATGAVVALVALGALTLTACTNGSMSKLAASLSSTSGSTATAAPLINVVSILRDTTDPSGTFDILGDGSGSIGTYCVGTTATSPNQGPSSCTCVYSYVNPTTGATETQEVSTTYQEANMVKCTHGTVPSAVTNILVELHIQTTTPQVLNSYSNQVSFSFGTSATGFDTSKASSFARAQRYTCRDIVSVPSVLSESADMASPMYDPYQSENPINSYPLNFYTSNLGQSIQAYGGGAGGNQPTTDWDCPPNLVKAPASYSSMIYSLSPLQGVPAGTAAKVISPRPGPATVGGPRPFDRETFYLAQMMSGVWQIPVNAIIAPGVATESPDGTGHATGAPAPLGFGASPISSGQSGVETCPDATVAIPAGYHWVKVWLFRMGLPTRQTLAGQKFTLLGDMACNPAPGNWPDAGAAALPYNAIFPGCLNAANLGNLGVFPLAARASGGFTGMQGSGMCWNVDAGGNDAVNYFASYGAAPGSDTWQPVQLPAAAAANYGYACGGTGNFDPVNTCSSYTASGGNTGLPYDSTPMAAPIGSANDIRYDFIFVVSPPTVMSRDMSDSSSAIYAQYTPYRFRADTDCGKPDPDTGGCSQAKALRNYGIKWHDVDSAGDPPANDPNRPGVFPVCALQPNG